MELLGGTEVEGTESKGELSAWGDIPESKVAGVGRDMGSRKNFVEKEYQTTYPQS